MRRLPWMLAIAAAALLAIGPGCKKNSVISPEPDPPRYVGAPFLNQDTTFANLGYVRLRFSWETDRTSVDVLYFGTYVDRLTDSVVAQNVDSPAPGGAVKYLHQSPSAALPALEFPTNAPFFYQVRSHGANGQSGFSQVYRYTYPY